MSKTEPLAYWCGQQNGGPCPGPQKLRIITKHGKRGLAELMKNCLFFIESASIKTLTNRPPSSAFKGWHYVCVLPGNNKEPWEAEKDTFEDAVLLASSKGG